MYRTEEPTRSEVDNWKGLAVLEFGANWCPICQAAQPDIQRALSAHPEIKHVMIEDGKGKPLGRSYRVKLWPNLVFLRDGEVVEQLARPSAQEVQRAVNNLVRTGGSAGA